MGRSVATHSRSIADVFFSFHVGYCPQCDFVTSGSSFNCDECGTELDTVNDGSWAWDDLVENIQSSLTERFPSLQCADHWPQSEVHAIAENAHCAVVISEYCGLVALGVVPVEWDGWYGDSNTEGLARTWAERYLVPFLRQQWGELRHVGTFSNGEAVYERSA